MDSYAEPTETVHKSGSSCGLLKSSSHGKVPKWLEDMSE
jgi:hypothetical protein